MNRARFLAVYGIDARRWARRHDIVPFSAPCDVCGRELTTTLPIAHGKLRGLAAPTCKCGNSSTPYCVVGLFD